MVVRNCCRIGRSFPKTALNRRSNVNEGYVNFATSLNDYILVYAIQKFLLREGGRASTSRPGEVIHTREF